VRLVADTVSGLKTSKQSINRDSSRKNCVNLGPRNTKWQLAITILLTLVMHHCSYPFYM